ncbi:MAG: hypothetical protein Q9225_008128, partial [Loekoesia sp. 1 TL-2023]
MNTPVLSPTALTRAKELTGEPVLRLTGRWELHLSAISSTWSDSIESILIPKIPDSPETLVFLGFKEPAAEDIFNGFK